MRAAGAGAFAWLAVVLSLPSASAEPIVRLRANKLEVRLQQQRLDDWVDVCAVPCGVPAPPDALYRVGGAGLSESREFRLPRSSGDVLIEARASSAAKRVAGSAVTVLGIAVGGLGIVKLNQGPSGPTEGDESASAANKAVGTICLIVGALVTAVGLGIWGTSGTSVDVR